MGGRHKRRVGKEGGDDAAGDEEEQPEWEQEETNLPGHRPDPRAVQNKHWTTYYKEQRVVPEGEWDEFEAAMRLTLPVSFRLTGCASEASVASLRSYMKHAHVSKLLSSAGSKLEPIAWYPNEMAWRFDVSRAELRGKGPPNPLDASLDGVDTRDPSLVRFHQFLKREGDLGALSRQEEVSMIPPLVLGVEPHHSVLDVCAAPGSKTQQLIEALEADGAHGPRGYVVANDADLRRCRLLIHQCARLDSAHVIVTHHEAQLFPSRLSPSAELRFDRVLCDVPCSSDGTLRKSPDLWKRWHDKLALGLHRLQLHIACRGVELAKVGGRVVYSTCSLNPLEDEAVVCALLAKYSGKIRLLDACAQVPLLKRSPTLSTWRVRANGGEWFSAYDELPAAIREGAKVRPSMFAPAAEVAAGYNLQRCLRVLPHNQNTGGFFVALFEKLDEVEGNSHKRDGAAGRAAAPVAASEEVASAEAAGAEAEAAAGGDGGGEGAGEGGAEARKARKQEAGSSARGAAASEAGGSEPEAGGSGGGADKPARNFVERVLHGTGVIGGQYDKLFVLKRELLLRLQEFYGIDTARLPLEQLVSRSPSSKSIYFVSDTILRMLRADVSTKLSVVNTGIRVMEHTAMKGLQCEYRLCQEGLRTLVARRLITRQLVHAPVSDLLLLYQKRAAVRADEFTPATARQLREETSVGCFALVSEMDEQALPGEEPAAAGAAGGAASGAEGAGEKRRHLLVCTAMWTGRASVDILVSKQVSNSALIWLGNSGYRATSYDQSNNAAKDGAADA